MSSLINAFEKMLGTPAKGPKDDDGSEPAQDSVMEGSIAALKELLPKDGSGGSYSREKLRDAALKLSLALETPGDTVQRVAYLPLQTAAVRVANTLDIFNILVKHNTSMSGVEISKAVNADHLLMTRLLRYLAATGCVTETGVDTYTANNITKNLTVPNLKAGVDHTFDIVDTSGMALPSFLSKTNYRNPTDPKHCPFNDALNTKDAAFEWFPKHPVELQNFNMWMTGQREGRAGWLDFFPFEAQVSNGFEPGDAAVMLVDIGGAFGHEVQAIKAKYPKLPGKIVLQDLPSTIKDAIKVPGMEEMAHDFFTPQPIQGARAYYLRNILHDWPDEKCVEILSRIAPAMKKGYSKILLNEFVLPDQGASLIATQVDMTMMVALAGAERTESQFKALVDTAGLQLTKIWGDDPDTERILEIELK